jgi:hypothetical protein
VEDRRVDTPEKRDETGPRLATPQQAKAIRDSGGKTSFSKRKTGKSALRIEPSSLSLTSGLQIK